MKAVLKLEAIGDNETYLLRRARRLIRAAAPGVAGLFRDARPRPWVARLTGLCPRYGFVREFLPAQKDYREANSVGSRGVFLYYWLDPGVYEVNERRSWRAWDRYFIRVEEGRWTRITRQETARTLLSGSAG